MTQRPVPAPARFLSGSKPLSLESDRPPPSSIDSSTTSALSASFQRMPAPPQLFYRRPRSARLRPSRSSEEQDRQLPALVGIHGSVSPGRCPSRLDPWRCQGYPRPLASQRRRHRQLGVSSNPRTSPESDWADDESRRRR